VNTSRGRRSVGVIVPEEAAGPPADDCGILRSGHP
jgi:hypothetical protein